MPMLTISFFTIAFVFVFSGVFFFGLGLFTEFSSEKFELYFYKCIVQLFYNSPRRACAYGMRRDEYFFFNYVSPYHYTNMFVLYTLFGDDSILTFFLEL